MKNNKLFIIILIIISCLLIVNIIITLKPFHSYADTSMTAEDSPKKIDDTYLKESIMN